MAKGQKGLAINASVVGDRLPITNHQIPVTAYRASVTAYQPPNTGHREPDTKYRAPVPGLNNYKPTQLHDYTVTPLENADTI